MMTDDEMRVAILEKMGWRHLGITGGALKGCPPSYIKGSRAPHSFAPNPLTDLNACHEMEKAVLFEYPESYPSELEHIVTDGKRNLINLRFKLLHATARQRCEAFARVCWPERWAK